MSEPTVDQQPVDPLPGFYGKIPVLGDFVSRGLPRSFITPWDTWQQEAIANSQDQLKDDWLENYLTSPLWRFALTPGICGENSWAGVVMPSVDRVGRYFPLTLATQLKPGQCVFNFMEQSDPWFSRMEEIALSCLEDDFRVEDLEQQLRTCAAPSLESTHVPETNKSRDSSSNAWHAGLESQSDLQSIYPKLLPPLLKKLLFAYSVWWTQGSEKIAPSLLLCQGLPHMRGTAGLIDGDWQKHGWEEVSAGAYSLKPLESDFNPSL